MKNTQEKLINNIVKFAQQAGYNTITEELTKKMNEITEKEGTEKALQVAEYTLNKFKKDAKIQENTLIHSIKNELFKVAGNTPTAKREIIKMIKAGELEKYNIKQVKEFKKRFLEIA